MLPWESWPNCGTDPSSFISMLKMLPIYASHFVFCSNGSPSVPRRYFCGDVKNSAEISVRSDSLTAESVSDRTALLMRDWPSGSASVGLYARATIMGCPILWGIDS